MFLLEVKQQTTAKIWQDTMSFKKPAKAKDFFSFAYIYEIKL